MSLFKNHKLILSILSGLILIVFFCNLQESAKDLSKMSGSLATIFNAFSIFSLFVSFYDKDSFSSKETKGFIICIGYGFLGALFGLSNVTPNIITVIFAFVAAFIFQLVVILFAIKHRVEHKNELSYFYYFYIIGCALSFSLIIFLVVALSR